MKAVLEIELRGDNSVQLWKLFRMQLNDALPAMGDVALGSMPPAGWVAEIIGIDKKYKYARKFLRYKKDYSRSNSVGSRGVFAEYILESGKLYDVKEWDKRYFCTVDSNTGAIVKIKDGEVNSWIKSASESTSMTPPSNA